MEMTKPRTGFTDREQTIADLERLLQAIEQPPERPCPNCQHPKELKRINQCQSQCPDAPRALSSDPENHPIEPLVLKIVFELNKLNQYQPCWSCEGSLDDDGEIYRLPQVNFYTANPIYALLIQEHLELLHYGQHLHVAWHIGLTSIGQKAGPTYILEPSPKGDSELILEELQEDLQIIGKELTQHLRLITETRLASLRLEQSGESENYCQRL